MSELENCFAKGRSSLMESHYSKETGLLFHLLSTLSLWSSQPEVTPISASVFNFELHIFPQIKTEKMNFLKGKHGKVSF